MTEINPYLVMRYGVIFLGFVMLYAAGRGSWTGTTRGYYADHVYKRDSDPGAYYRWVVLRGALAVGCLALGFFLPG